MSDIGPGDFVEFVGFPADPPGFPGPLVRGRLYQVEAVSGGSCTCGKPGGLTLVGGPSPEPFHRGWCVFGFRPVYRPRAGAFDALAAPARIEPNSPSKVSA